MFVEVVSYVGFRGYLDNSSLENIMHLKYEGYRSRHTQTRSKLSIPGPDIVLTTFGDSSAL